VSSPAPDIVTVKMRRRGSQRKPLLVIIGKKAARRAVARNKFKRRVREIMRPFVERGSSDFTVIAHPGAAEAPFDELTARIKEQIR